eukprot:4212911-Pyramimonas_sp.AAC.1
MSELPLSYPAGSRKPLRRGTRATRRQYHTCWAAPLMGSVKQAKLPMHATTPARTYQGPPAHNADIIPERSKAQAAL